MKVVPDKDTLNILQNIMLYNIMESCLYFTTCASVFIVVFEQVSAGWEAKVGEKKQVRSIIVNFEQVNAGCVRNMYVSSGLKNHITTETRKGVTLYVKLNFELLPLASISFATLSMYFVD